jgi:hypothetical protein
VVHVKLEFHLEGGLIESLELMGERAADPGPPLRKWGTYKRKEVKALIQSEEGFAPLASSTLLKRQRSRTGRVTRHGHLRSAYAKRLDARSKRIQGLIAWSQRRYLGLGRVLGPSAGIQKKVARWQKELEAINPQHDPRQGSCQGRARDLRRGQRSRRHRQGPQRGRHRGARRADSSAAFPRAHGQGCPGRPAVLGGARHQRAHGAAMSLYPGSSSTTALRHPGRGGAPGTPTRDLPYYTARSAPEGIARRVVTQLQLKLGVRLGTVALRALSTSALDDRGAVAAECVYLTERSVSYRWKRMEIAPDDGDTAILPDDVEAGEYGRWVKAPFRDFERRFYLRHVQLVHNSLRRKDLEELASGKHPALFVSFVSRSPRELSQCRGALQWDELTYRVRAISANWRGEPGANLGSDAPGETTVAEDFDPGAVNVIADCEQFLRENIRLNDPRISRVIIGAARSLEQWGNERLQMDELTFTVHACTWVPNIPQDLVGVDLIKVQLQDIDNDLETTDIGEPVQVGV